jgi:hypothetical protein
LTMHGFISQRYRADPGAAAWDAYLDYRLRWSLADLGGVPIWDEPIPPRQDWDSIVQRLNGVLRGRELAEECATPPEFPAAGPGQLPGM